jgi:hypothetical protein
VVQLIALSILFLIGYGAEIKAPIVSATCYEMELENTTVPAAHFNGFIFSEKINAVLTKKLNQLFKGYPNM